MYINSNGKADTLRRNMKENESMKKWIVLTLALALALSLFAAAARAQTQMKPIMHPCPSRS